jgi:hypothetical protein
MEKIHRGLCPQLALGGAAGQSNGGAPPPSPLALAPDKAFPIGLATAQKMNWTIVKASPTTRRNEAGERSFWMGFTDDIVVRSPSRIPKVASKPGQCQA